MNTSAGDEVRARRQHLGMTIKDLATEAGLSRDTLSDLESGSSHRTLTLTKVQRTLDSLEGESGASAPRSDGLIEFSLSAAPDIRVSLRGPVSDMEELENSIYRLVRKIRAEHDDDESVEPQGDSLS